MPKQLETRKREVKVGDTFFEIESHVQDGETLDTVISCKSNKAICVVAGSDVNNFFKEINELIEKYKI